MNPAAPRTLAVVREYRGTGIVRCANSETDPRIARDSRSAFWGVARPIAKTKSTFLTIVFPRLVRFIGAHQTSAPVLPQDFNFMRQRLLFVLGEISIYSQTLYLYS